MAACLTAGRTKPPCDTLISGGVKEIYMVDRSDVDTITVGVGGDVTAITMLAAADFFKFEFASNTAQFTDTLDNTAGTIVTQVIRMTWKGRSQDDINAIMALAACQCGLVVIHVENNGNTYIWGADETEEALLLNSNGDSGTLKSDPNQEEVFIQAIATKKARTFTGTIPV
jgi:hypothetical protein